MCLRLLLMALLLASLYFVAPKHSIAQASIDDLDDALTLISNFINENCQRPEASGTRSEIGGNVKVDAKLKGLTKLLADIGGEIGANVKHVKWDGLDQSHLAEAMASGNSCSTKMAELLTPRLLPQTSMESIEPNRVGNSTKRRDDVSAFYGERRNCGKILIWHNKLHETPQDCLSKLGYGPESVCRRLPEYLHCSYEAVLDSTTLHPTCHWTAEDCDTHFEFVIAKIKKMQASGFAIPQLIACEKVLSRQAVKQYETYRNLTYGRRLLASAVSMRYPGQEYCGN